jgi:hypothetical protein
MGGTSYTSHNLKQMRRTLLILALSLPLLSACASGGGGMRPRYDASEGESNVEQVILQTPEGVRMTARYSWQGRGAPAPAQNALLSFDAPRGGTDSQWRTNNQLQVTVDGQRARYNGRYSTAQGERGSENVLYQIPITDLSVIADATRVEGRIGRREFVLERAELARLRAFVAYVRGGGE